jgi:MFS family permease
VCAGLAALGCVAIGAALAPGPLWLAAALLLYGPASGAGVSLAQATLVDTHPDERERWLARWTLAGELGDLAAPGLLAAAALAGAGWRGAFLVAGLLVLAYAALLARRPFPASPPSSAGAQRAERAKIDRDDPPSSAGAQRAERAKIDRDDPPSSAGAQPATPAEPAAQRAKRAEIGQGGSRAKIDRDDPPSSAAAQRGEAERGSDEPEAARRSDGSNGEPVLRTALRERRLVLWLGGVALCALLDETLVAFAALHLRDELGAGPGALGLALAASTAGGAVGLAAAERLLRRADPLALLRAACAGCGVAYAAWVFAESLAASVALFVAVGFFAAPLYPIALAQAYRALPGRAATVNAVGQLFAPLELAVPILLGFVADAAGLRAALLLLLVQPLALLALAWRRRAR